MTSPNIVSLAIGRMPSSMQHEAHQVLLLTAAGYGTVEIAGKIETSWRRVNEIRENVASQLVCAFRSEGYSDGEIRSTLRVPSMVITNGQPTTAGASAHTERL